MRYDAKGKDVLRARRSYPAEVMHCEMYNKFGWYHGSDNLSSLNTVMC